MAQEHLLQHLQQATPLAVRRLNVLQGLELFMQDTLGIFQGVRVNVLQDARDR